MSGTCNGTKYFKSRLFVREPRMLIVGHRRYAASVVTSVSYGRRVESVDEWIVKENNDSMDCELSCQCYAPLDI